jgi:FkbM family methyltransferase
MKVMVGNISFSVVPAVSRPQDDPWLGGSKLFWEAVNRGKWESKTFEVLRRYLNPNFSYFDIGAWVGPTVLFGAQISKACYAFEPDPAAFEGLQRNIAVNTTLNNIKAYELAISHNNGTVSMGTRTGRGDSMSNIFSSKDKWLVEATTLETFSLENNVSDLNFIKMDIEGAEVVVLPSSFDFFFQRRPTLFLSLHAQFFKDRLEYFRQLTPALSIYRHLYDENGAPLAITDLPKIPNLQNVIATDLSNN